VLGVNFLKYGIIGVFNTLVGYGLTFYLFYIDVFPELANLLGYVVGFFVSYYLNKKFNFKSKNSHRDDLPKFIISMSIAYIVNLIVFMSLSRIFGLNLYVAQIIAGIFYIGVGYFMSTKWVFKEIKEQN